jgi:tetratricopeptide (TPR) repeat protein
MSAKTNKSAAVAAGWTAWILSLIILTGCGGAPKVNTGLHIPDLDLTQYNDSQYEMGWQALKTGKPAQALEHFQLSNSADEKLYVGFGYAYMALNKMMLAKKNFDKALGINADNLQAHLGIANMHEVLKDKESAFLIYSRLRAKYPEHAWIKVRYESIKSAETQRYLEEAELQKSADQMGPYVEALLKASRFSPEIIDIKIKIGDYYRSQELYERAVKHYEEALEKVPNNEDLLVKLADVYEKLEKYDSAVLMYKKMQEFKPGDLDISNKVNELKMKFYEVNLPVKFKNIFFKEQITREELAALIGYYFDKYLEPRPPVIITDIGVSFAKEHIIKVCTLNIMKLRPDHSFGRFPIIKRAQFAVVLDALITYLEKSEAGAYTIQFTPLDEVVEPADISPLHKYYNIIKFLVNSRIMKLDEVNNFNPTQSIPPARVLTAIRKILNSIRER